MLGCITPICCWLFSYKQHIAFYFIRYSFISIQVSTITSFQIIKGKNKNLESSSLHLTIPKSNAEYTVCWTKFSRSRTACYNVKIFLQGFKLTNRVNCDHKYKKKKNRLLHNSLICLTALKFSYVSARLPSINIVLHNTKDTE